MSAITLNKAADRAAAVRHVVYRDLLDRLSVASYDQALQFAANLRLRATTPAQKSAALVRFLGLRATPDIAETPGPRAGAFTLPELELYFNRKCAGELAHVAGFYRRDGAAAFRLNLPFRSILYGYKSDAGFYNGILCQPVNALDQFFLLSSAKFGGQKALRLSPRDQQYFTQFEEVTI